MLSTQRAEPVSDLNVIVNSLRHIVRAIRTSSHAAETTSGISGAQLFVLQQLAAHPAASLGEVAGLTLTDQSSVSVVVSRLVRRRLVARRTSARDGRRIELSLTDKGRELLEHAPELAQGRLVTALGKVKPGDLRTVRRVLGQVARDLGAGTTPPEMFFESGGGGPAASARRRPRAAR